MVELGTRLPTFSLEDAVSGSVFSNASFNEGAGLLVMFICNHCPYVIHVRDELTRLAKDYEGKVGLVAINSNDIGNYPQDGPDHMKSMANELGWKFPFLFDESQKVGRAFGAECTPDFFLYDGDQKLFYRGQLDGTRPGRGAPDGKDLRAALDALLAGNDASVDQKPSVGCNIKWR
jgi:thiol-disulfide isomerase/thioredoxin